MTSNYLAQLTLIEHSYVKSSAKLKTRFTKLPTQILFRLTEKIYEGILHKKYYTFGNSEMQILRDYYLKINSSAFSDDILNSFCSSSTNSEVFKKLLAVLKEYSICVQRLYHGQISESTLRTHRIVTEYFGPRFLAVLLSMSSDLIASFVGAILKNINETYLLYFFELLIYSKSQVNSLEPLFYSKNGVFKNEFQRLFWDGRFTFENLSKLVEIMWTPTMLPGYLPNFSPNQLSILLIPPLPFAMKLDTGVGNSDSQNDDTYTWIDRFDSFRRNLTSIGAMTFYRTDYVPTIQLDDDEGLKYCALTLSNNINNRIIGIKNRHPAGSVILIGWSVSASIAYKLYLNNPKNVQCLILINFPTSYNSGDKKIFTESQIEETKCPVMFITGSESTLSNPSDIETLRDSLQCPTSFIYAKHCDDLLNMSLKHRLALNVPQDIVDIKLIEKISSFIKHHYSGDRMEAYQWELVDNDCFSDSDDVYPSPNSYPF